MQQYWWACPTDRELSLDILDAVLYMELIPASLTHQGSCNHRGSCDKVAGYKTCLFPVQDIHSYILFMVFQHRKLFVLIFPSSLLLSV